MRQPAARCCASAASRTPKSRCSSVEDSEALEKLSGGRDAPTLTIGSQIVRGMAPDLWNSYLDAAGYPRESKLPSSYQYRPPTPIVERREAAAAARAPQRPRRAGVRRARAGAGDDRRHPLLASQARQPAARDRSTIGCDAAGPDDARRRRPMRRADRLPAPTAAAMIQNSAAAPSAAPPRPNISGITALEKLIVIERNAIASPWRSCGVIWCKRRHDHRLHRAEREAEQHRADAHRPRRPARADRPRRRRPVAQHRADQHLRLAQAVRERRDDDADQRHRGGEDAEHEADRRRAEAALVAEDRHAGRRARPSSTTAAS